MRGLHVFGIRSDPVNITVLRNFHTWIVPFLIWESGPNYCGRSHARFELVNDKNISSPSVFLLRGPKTALDARNRSYITAFRTAF